MQFHYGSNAEPANAEAALFYLLLQGDEELRGWLQPQHFRDPFRAGVLTEIKEMEGPLDPAAIARHFRRQDVIARLKLADFDAFCSHMADDLGHSYASAANKDYYKRIVQEIRIKRGLHRIAIDLARKAKTEPPEATIEWLEQATERLKKCTSPPRKSNELSAG